MKEIVEAAARGIFGLPNEVLLDIFNLLPTELLLPLTPTCRHFHSLILRTIHNRLQVTSELEDNTLYLECHPPSAQLTASKMFCTSIGTDGLQDLMSAIQDEENYVGQIKSMFGLYSRFRPQRRDPGISLSWRHPAVDVPGSRTYRDSSSQAQLPPSDIVSETINVDAQDLFSQLSTLAYLGKREPRQGLLYSIQEVSEGTVRVWRDWLSRQCESKKWTDGESIVVHHDGVSSSTSSRARADSVTGRLDPSNDPAILWLNTRDENLGIKLRVKERKMRKNNTPILYSSDIELPVSYQVEFEEIVVRTTHLLVKVEEAQKRIDDDSGKAIVFGSFRR